MRKCKAFIFNRKCIREKMCNFSVNDFKKAAMVFAVLSLTFFLSSCSADDNNNEINIAVLGSPAYYSEFYRNGLELAYKDVLKEYSDSGFDINVEFYDDNDNYKIAEELTAKIVNDEKVTAIISSVSEDICANQAYQADRENKLMIAPHWMYDKTLIEHNYKSVFYLNYSSKQIGEVFENIIINSPAKTWAVCCSDDEISRAEVERLNSKSELNIVDFVDDNILSSKFDETVRRWKLLGVEGVVFLPYDGDFDLFYRLKEAMPEVYVASDSTLDDENEVSKNKKYFNNVYIVSNFCETYEESEVKQYGDKFVDTWESHGYNALRIIVDTAVKNKTNDPMKIAEALHRDGYKGCFENYVFDENGNVIPSNLTYFEMGDENWVIDLVPENN